MAKQNHARAIFQQTLDAVKQAGTWKEERILCSPQGSTIHVLQAPSSPQSQEVLNFCANNYLGLSGHRAVVTRSRQALDSHGAGLGSVRFICGTQDIHKELEEVISRFHGHGDTILYPSCFDANAGIFEALLGPDDAILSDELNHASIIDGVRLCKAQRFRYRHRDMAELEHHLISTQKTARLRLIATDGVFSMDGSLAPLPDICALAEQYNALVFVDDCHATGFLGARGTGTAELAGVQGRVDIVNSTLGKAMGGASGGYTTASRQVVQVLRQRSRPYLFSNSLPPAVVGAALGAFQIVQSAEGDALRQQLLANTHLFRSEMNRAGFSLKASASIAATHMDQKFPQGSPDHPITPIMLGDARLATSMAQQLLAEGIYVIGFSYPVVPKGQARIRVQLSATHTTEQVEKAIAAFIRVGRQLAIL